VTAQLVGLREPPHGERKPVNVTPFLPSHPTRFAPGRTLLSYVTDVADPSDENSARGRTNKWLRLSRVDLEVSHARHRRTVAQAAEILNSKRCISILLIFLNVLNCFAKTALSCYMYMHSPSGQRSIESGHVQTSRVVQKKCAKINAPSLRNRLQ